MIEKNTTLYKLMVLFMLEKANAAMSSAHFSDFILEKGYTDYFTLQASLSELEEAGLVNTVHAGGRTLFTLSEEGANSLRFYSDRISEDIKREMTQYLLEKNFELEEENSALSEYFEDAKGSYRVRCRIMEKGKQTVEINLSVPTIEQAQAICLQWNEKYYEVYECLMDILLR